MNDLHPGSFSIRPTDGLRLKRVKFKNLVEPQTVCDIVVCMYTYLIVAKSSKYPEHKNTIIGPLVLCSDVLQFRSACVQAFRKFNDIRIQVL